MNDRPIAFGVEPSRARFRLRLARYVDLAERIERLADGSDFPRLLDIGCGKGRLKSFCASASDKLTWVGLDPQDWRLRCAREVPGWDLVKGGGEKLPFADGAFDVVVCSQVLEHFDRPQDIVAEARRVLSPGGTLLLSVPVFPPGAAWLAETVVRSILRLPGVRERWHAHEHFFSTWSLKRLVRTGFALRGVIGLRLLSVIFLENFRFYYRLNRWLGRQFPFLSIEVNLEAVKR